MNNNVPNQNAEHQNICKFLTVTEFAKKIGVHPQTVRTWDRTGKLKADHRSMGGKRLYSEQQVTEYLNLFPLK